MDFPCGCGNDEVLKKLDDVLANQQAILTALAQMREEIQIIKIRVTQVQ